jgi:MtN3 and saliva related transmembrane protein
MISDTLLGIIATCFTTAAFLPQVWKVVKTNNTKSIALLFIGIKMTGSALWTTYGIMIKNNIIIYSCAIVLVCTAIIFAHKVRNIITRQEKF